MGFSNNKKDFFKNVDKLPDELIAIIYSFVPKEVTTFLNKINYVRDHNMIKKFIGKKNVEEYIRCMIRQDNNFVLDQLLVENQKKWLNMKKYYYKETIYSNYIMFLDSYAMDYYSENCRKSIWKFLEELGLSKNQHKKNNNKYIRWKI